MIIVRPIKTFPELQRLMPLFLEGFREMNKRHKAFDCDEEGFVKTLAWVLGGDTDKNVIGIAWDGNTPVGYGVGFDDTPIYSKRKHFLLWALYVKPAWSKLAGKELFDGAETFAASNGYDVLRANNGRLNGSAIKFFEKVLEMRRNRLEFTKQLS